MTDGLRFPAPSTLHENLKLPPAIILPLVLSLIWMDTDGTENLISYHNLYTMLWNANVPFTLISMACDKRVLSLVVVRHEYEPL